MCYYISNMCAYKSVQNITRHYAIMAMTAQMPTIMSTMRSILLPPEPLGLQYLYQDTLIPQVQKSY